MRREDETGYLWKDVIHQDDPVIRCQNFAKFDTYSKCCEPLRSLGERDDDGTGKLWRTNHRQASHWRLAPAAKRAGVQRCFPIAGDAQTHEPDSAA